MFFSILTPGTVAIGLKWVGEVVIIALVMEFWSSL